MPPNIDITADHVDLLKQAGSGSLLVWEETTGAVRTADAARPDQLGAHTLVVAGYEQLAFAGADADPQAQDPAALPAARLVPALQELAEEAGEEWPLIRALTPTAQPLRQALAAWGLHLCRTVGAWHLRGHGSRSWRRSTGTQPPEGAPTSPRPWAMPPRCACV